jgi:hypothetical protein
MMRLLLKCGSYENMQSLIQKGTIYCNSLSFFAAFDDSCRFDTHEISTNLDSQPPVKVQLTDDEKSAIYIGKVEIKDVRENPTGNIFCIYGVNDEDFPVNSKWEFDDRLQEFGEYCVLIYRMPEFFEKMEKGLNDLKLQWVSKTVKYLDFEEHIGQLDVNHKSDVYDWQREYRFRIFNDKPEPIIFEIGSLEDIAVLMRVDNLKNIIVYKREDGIIDVDVPVNNL